MRLLFFGTYSAFSSAALQTLLAANHTPVGVVLPQRPPAALPEDFTSLPLIEPATPPNLAELARAHGLSLHFWRDDLPPADLIVVACFPHRLPPRLLDHPTHAALNLHPSWLPFYRGPVPVFWQLRAGLTELGVTVHHMDRNFDTGDIAAQQTVPLPPGLTGPEIDALLASHGAHLLVSLLHPSPLPRLPQPPNGTYQSWPQTSDWEVPLIWPVRHAFNFMRGVAEWGYPFFVHTPQRTYQLATAHHYEETPTASPGEVRATGDGWRLGFSDGWLWASAD